MEKQNKNEMREIEKTLCKMAKMSKKELDANMMGSAFFTFQMRLACEKFLTPEQQKMLFNAFMETLAKMRERNISCKLGIFNN